MRSRGFTLIELLIIIAIIGFLAAAVLVAVDPVKRIQDSRDARRASEANAILNAILNKQVDDVALFGGDASHPIDTDAASSQIIVNTGSGLTACATMTCGGDGTLTLPATSEDCYADLSDMTPEYIAEIPLDPNGGTAIDSGYYINRDASGRIEVGACNPEQQASVKVKR